MSFAAEVTALRASPMFRDAEPQTLQLLAFLADVEDFSPGEALCLEGEEGDCAFVILEGAAEIWVGAGEARQMVSVVGRHQLVGEIAVLCGTPRTADVIAQDDVRALRIEKTHLLQLLSETPSMALTVMRELASRLRATTLALAAAQADGGAGTR